MSAAIWTEHRKAATTMMRPYVFGEDMTGITIGNGVLLEEGGWICRSTVSDIDQWYISPEYYAENYTPVQS